MKRLTVRLVAGVVALAATATARASITAFDWNEAVVLRLSDARTIEGRFHGELGTPKDTMAYAPRYERWRESIGWQWAPALGESLIVTHGPGAPARGAFRGFANGMLLLGTPDSCVHLVVRLGGNVEVRRTADPAMDSDWLAARPLWKRAPSLHAIELSTEGERIAVPTSVIVKSSQKPDAGSSMAGGILLGLVVGVVLAGLAAPAAWAAVYSQPVF